jgi:hypothetical protein
MNAGVTGMRADQPVRANARTIQLQMLASGANPASWRGGGAGGSDGPGGGAGGSAGAAGGGGSAAGPNPPRASS